MLPVTGSRIKAMKNLWRTLFIAAVSLGGVALVRVMVEILNRENKKYIDI